MEFTGHIVGLAKDWESKLWHITLSMDEDTALETIEGFTQFEKLVVKISKYVKKRSLEANAYMWSLIGQIAQKKKQSNDYVYWKALCSEGVFDLKEDGSPITMTIDADVEVSEWQEHWKPIARVWDEKEQKMKVSYIKVKGTSTYDVSEMQKILDYIIAEAKSLGIRTETDYDYQLMLDKWAEDYAKRQRRKKYYNR